MYGTCMAVICVFRLGKEKDPTHTFIRFFWKIANDATPSVQLGSWIDLVDQIDWFGIACKSARVLA